MTEPLQRLLAPDATSGVYRLAGRTSARTVAQLAAAAGWQCHLLDASAVHDKPGFLQLAGTALRFPGWAGRNWDAFEELINDLAWLPPAPGYLLLLDRLSHFAARAPRDLALAIEILRDATARREPPPLIVLLRGAGSAAAAFEAVEVGR